MTQTKWIPMQVRYVYQETEQLVSLQLEPAIEESQFEFRPGQYVKIRTQNGTEKTVAIASEPEEKRFIEFLLKDVSSDELARVKIDERVQVSTAMGKGYPVERLKGKNVLLVGMGTALAPLRSTIRSILRNERNFRQITLVYGLREPQELPFIDDFNLWKTKIRVEIAVSHPGKSFWQGHVGRVTDFLPTLALSPENLVACVCGNKEMEKGVAEFLVKLGVKKDDILLNY